jgi:hypothetical protein
VGIYRNEVMMMMMIVVVIIIIIIITTGYEEHISKTKISHLLYMNGLKLIAKSEDELRKQIQLKLLAMISIWTLD